MTDYPSKFLDEDVSDPTDFPSDALGLRELDDALRCSVCREFYQAPVTVNCPQGHGFCSLCIRNAITTKDECPSCREKILEVHIRRNPSMEEAVKAWYIARPFVLEILKERGELERLRAMEKECKKKPQSRKRKRTPESDDDVVEIVAHSRSGTSKQSSSPSASSTPPPGSVECPICTRHVPMDDINRHLDSQCGSVGPSRNLPVTPTKNKGKQKQEWSRLFQGGGRSPSGSSRNKGKPRTPEEILSEPLPRLAYDTLKLKRLRELLEENDLPTTGDRTVLAARHARWVNMYNANLDAAPGVRKTQKQLRLELRRWDEAEERRRAKSKVDKDVDPQAYQKEHRAAFARLVEAAKPKRPEKLTEQKRPNGKSNPSETEHPGAEDAPENGDDSAAEDLLGNLDGHPSGPPSSVVDVDMSADNE